MEEDLGLDRERATRAGSLIRGAFQSVARKGQDAVDRAQARRLVKKSARAYARINFKEAVDLAISAVSAGADPKDLLAAPVTRPCSEPVALFAALVADSQHAHASRAWHAGFMDHSARYPLIFSCAAENDRPKVRALLAIDPRMVLLCDPRDGQSPLHYATGQHDVEMVRLLLPALVFVCRHEPENGDALRMLHAAAELARSNKSARPLSLAAKSPATLIHHLFREAMAPQRSFVDQDVRSYAAQAQARVASRAAPQPALPALAPDVSDSAQTARIDQKRGLFGALFKGKESLKLGNAAAPSSAPLAGPPPDAPPAVDPRDASIEMLRSFNLLLMNKVESLETELRASRESQARKAGAAASDSRARSDSAAAPAIDFGRRSASHAPHSPFPAPAGISSRLPGRA